MEYFYNSVLEINYTREYMKIYPSIDSIDISDYTRVDLIKEVNRLYIPLKVRINDSLLIEGRFQLDFGSGGELTFTSSATEKFSLAENISKKTPYFTKYGGVGGESSSYVFRAASFEIADFSFDSVTVSYNVDRSGALATDRHLGLLGNGIYERFNVIIDFLNNDIYLKPNSKFNDPFEFSRLGFAYVDRNQTLGSWIVTGLFRASEPEKNGLGIDDRILEINGVSVAMIDYEAQKDFFSGLDEVKLLVERNGQQKMIEFKLQYIQ